MANSICLPLEEVSCIARLNNLQSTLEDALDARKDIEIDCISLSKIDTAALQSLVMMRLEFIKSGLSWRWQNCNEVLYSSAHFLGLSQPLALPAQNELGK